MTRLEEAVRRIVEEQEDKDAFVSEVLTYGCESGIVGELVYTEDIHRFFDEYYDDIDELRQEFEENCGKLDIKGDLKTFLTWFAFEETVLRLYG